MLIERREMGATEGVQGSDSEMKANLARVLLSNLVVIEVAESRWPLLLDGDWREEICCGRHP